MRLYRNETVSVFIVRARRDDAAPVDGSGERNYAAIPSTIAP